MTTNVYSLRNAAAAVSAFTLAAATAIAGPPLLTDDPDTPERGHFEVNVAWTMERGADGWSHETPLLDFNYGLRDDIQLKFEMPWIVADPDGASRRSGIGNAEFGIKWRFLDEEKSGISASAYPQFAFNATRRSVRKELVEPGWEFLLPVEVSRTFGKTTVFGEAGYVWTRDGGNGLLWGVAAEREIGEHFSVLAELHGESGTGFRAHSVVFNVGAHLQLEEHTALIFSAGRGIRSDDGDETKLLGYAGLQFTF